MRKRFATSFLVIALGATGSFAAATHADQRPARPSARIAAFGDAAPAPKPDTAPPAPAPPAAKNPTADVLLGAVIPSPPRVELASGGGKVRPYDGRRAVGGFEARPAAATRLALNSSFGVRTDPLTGMLRMHTGVDVRASFGESVGASMSGTVWFAGERAGYGNLVVVDHGSGVSTFYAHLSRIAVTVGQKLEAGQLLGYVGSTGRSTGPHLHYEVRANGRPIDPSTPIAFAGDELLVNGQSVGLASTSGPIVLPKAPGGTSISVDFDDPSLMQIANGQTLSIDWE